MSNNKVESWNIAKKKLMRHFLDREITFHYTYLINSEQPIERNIVEVNNKIEKIINDNSQMGDDGKPSKEYIKLLIELEQLKGFLNLLRQSFIASLYSFMELWILRECFLDSNRRDRGKSYRKFSKYRGIEKAKKYYLEIMKSNYSFKTKKDWQWINKLKRLRDCIMHRQGSLTGFSSYDIDKTLKLFVEKEDGLQFLGVKYYQVFIYHEFCEKSKEIVRRFMIELLSL